MEAAVFAPHQVAILALPAVEAEAAAAARRCTGRMLRTKIIELSGNGPEAVEHNLRRDRVRSWLSDDFVNPVK
uniref:Uncharacterized protein n=1 Tax=Oryza meridionalis TaxID=40149 RepID=A0A0E0BXB7_9ORYZ